MPNAITRGSILKVPGAQLYYEVQGSGPVLLMIPGGPADAAIFTDVAGFLADTYTVVRYDPCGNSRSILDGLPEEQRMDVHGDDAAQLLAAVGKEPAHVLGSSGGAQIGLNLAARHAEQVRTLIAHEPPCTELLPDAAEKRAFADSVYETYRSAGVDAGIQRFVAGTGLGGGPRPPQALPASPEMQEAFIRIKSNFAFFFAHGLKPISSYVPDVTTLRSRPVRIVVAVGETSSGQLAYLAAIALAERLGSAPVTFPGGHSGYAEQPAAFAEKVRQVLKS